MPGIVLEKAYVEAKGKAFGTPSGGTMCTGPFKLKSWKPGSALTAERNDGYWDTALKPKAASISFKGVSDDSSLTSGPADQRDHRQLPAAADHAGPAQVEQLE